MAQTYNIQLDQGSTYTMSVLYEEPDPTGAPGNVPIDITGYEARMQVREGVDATAVLAEFTSSPAAGLAVDGPAGTVELTVTSEQTAAYTFINAVYDLEIYDGSLPPVVVRLIQGRFLVNQEVTR